MSSFSSDDTDGSVPEIFDEEVGPDYWVRATYGN